MAAEAVVQVYTDGACSANGRAGAIAGIGVYWGDDDPRNVSRVVTGDAHTNNVAEMEAILVALRQIRESRSRAPHEVMSDSSYAIDCVTAWYAGFEARQWRTQKGTPVKNAELIRAIRAELDALPHVRLVKVRGHDGIKGNEEADRLAVAARERVLATP